MIYLNLFCAIFIMFLGIGYLARPDKISNFNEWMRGNIFSDRLLLNHRRKIGTFLLLLGFLLLYLSFI